MESAGMMRWLLTYADMITLLLIMFIVLYSAAAQDTVKFRNMAMYLRAAFGGVLTQGPTFLQGSGETIISELYPKIQSAVRPYQGEGTGSGEAPVSVVKEQRGIVVRLMTDNVLFERGSVELKGEMRDILNALAPVLMEANHPVLVEGHTCDLPMRGPSRFVSNWELSTARASSVVRYLIEAGKVPAKLLSAAGYAEYRPLVPNRDEAARRRNRRIDIVILEGPASSETAGQQTTQ
jgi:chemotaxis protein MotB